MRSSGQSPFGGVPYVAIPFDYPHDAVKKKYVKTGTVPK
jgi:hypothetical protein